MLRYTKLLVANMVEFRSAFAVLAATVFAAISSLSGQAAAWSSISVSRTLNIDGQPYYLPVEPIASLSNAPVSGEVLPFTTIVTNSGTITSDTIKSALASYKASDDVFTDSFLRGKLDSILAAQSGDLQQPSYRCFDHR